MRIAHHDYRRTRLEIGQTTQFQRHQSRRFDAYDGQIRVSIRGVDAHDLQRISIPQSNLEPPPFPNHVQIGGNQSVGVDDEAGAHSVVFAITISDADHGECRAGQLDEFLHGKVHILPRALIELDIFSRGGRGQQSTSEERQDSQPGPED